MSDETVYGEISIAAGGSQARMPIRGRKSRHTLVNGWTVRVEAPPEKGETIILPVLSLEEINEFIVWADRRVDLSGKLAEAGVKAGQDRYTHYLRLAAFLRWARQEAMKP